MNGHPGIKLVDTPGFGDDPQGVERDTKIIK